MRIRPRLPTQGSVADLLGQYYRTAPRMVQQLENILGEGGAPAQSQAAPTPTAVITQAPEPFVAPEEVARAPVVQALDMIVNQAVKDRALDIHIEPAEDNVRVRYRIDGVLHNAATLPKGVQSALISRVKVLAGMDIAERRRPQDGHFNLKVDGEDVDFRVASIETSHGEKVVMRILNKSSSIFSLANLGIQPDTLQIYNQLLESPFDMIVVSGPTGSGKTTSLYASLLRLDAASLNIMTIEDPIEYRFTEVNQTQVNEQASLTFAGGLRGLLRLDPDIILVWGRFETPKPLPWPCRQRSRATWCSHLSTPTTPPRPVTRLIDLGVEPFLVTSAVVGSVAQRLVRKLCPYCKTPIAVTPQEVSTNQMEMSEMVTQFYAGRGCNMCSRSGFAGRIGVFEVMLVTDQIKGLINQGASASEMRA